MNIKCSNCNSHLSNVDMNLTHNMNIQIKRFIQNQNIYNVQTNLYLHNNQQVTNPNAPRNNTTEINNLISHINVQVIDQSNTLAQLNNNINYTSNNG